MTRRHIRRAFQTWRPPSIHRVIDATATQLASPVVSLGVGRSIVEALDRLPVDPEVAAGDRTLLIPDPRRSGKPGPKLVGTVASWIAVHGGVTFAIPGASTDVDRRRWTALANRVGANLAYLGSSGWNRVESGDRSLFLTHADVPAELNAGTTIVALSAPDGAGSLGLWSSIVHPNTALRARLSPHGGMELSAAVNARYLLAGQIGSSWVTAFATTAISAELAARAIEHLRERLGGIESPGPWEDAGVQHLSGIGEEGLHAANLVLEARLDNNADEALARQLSDMLGWRLEIKRDDIVGGERDQG